MPGDSTKGQKHVQSLLAPKKPTMPGAKDTQANPPKRDKRTHSDVSEESIDSVDIVAIHSELKEIKNALQDTVTKSDLDKLVKQNDLKQIVTNIVQQLLSSFKQSITEEFNTKLREKTGKLQDYVDSLNIENENLKERLRQKDIQLLDLEKKVADCNIRSVDALRSANYNEQYSRKHNIRIVNLPEKPDENLKTEFIKLVKNDLKIELNPTDVVAIHRIPGKDGFVRPVLAKVRNTETKINIMRQKKGLTKDVKFHDDITVKNLGLMSHLKSYEDLDNIWFYNCSVYGKLKDSKHRIRFDLFDNFNEKIKKKSAELKNKI